MVLARKMIEGPPSETWFRIKDGGRVVPVNMRVREQLERRQETWGLPPLSEDQLRAQAVLMLTGRSWPEIRRD